jgi:hypothetical protein
VAESRGFPVGEVANNSSIPRIRSIFDFSAEALGQLKLWLDQNPPIIPLNQVQGIRYLTASKTWDPASVADGAVTNTTVTLLSATLGDFAVASFSLAVPANAILAAAVTAADTVTVTLFNKTGGALDLASGTLKVAIIR